MDKKIEAFRNEVMHWRKNETLGFGCCLASLHAQPATDNTEHFQSSTVVVKPLKGHIYVDVGGALAIPRGNMTKEFSEVMPGMSFYFGLGLRGIPLTLGLGYQQEFISSNSWSTNQSGLFIYNDQWGYGTLHLSRDLDVRHLDAVLHLEPEWHRFRPFIEVLGGTSQIFCNWSLLTTYGSGLTEEHTGGLTWTWGYGAGIRIEPFRPYADQRGSLAMVVSLGVRRRFAGKLRFLEPQGNTLNGVETVSFLITEPIFDVIQPYLFIGIVSRSLNDHPKTGHQ